MARIAPTVSICVPTHHGRREPLTLLLEGVCAQAAEFPAEVEVCVSDNASQDGTAEAVAAIAGVAPCTVRYERQAEDRGLARNLLRAVELASGRYCWLFGSDDLLADRALARLLALLQSTPGATAYVVGAVYVDAENPMLRSRALARDFHPAGDRTRRVQGLDAVYDECGNAWCALSWNVVDRTAWLRAVGENRATVLAHPVFPQVVALAAMARRRPSWAWLAEPLVHQRNATTFLFEWDRPAAAERWSQIISGVSGAWATVLGGRTTRRWRRRMRLLHRVWGSAEDVRATKLYERPSLRAQARLARACLLAFWPDPAYWRDVLPASLLPAWATRARYGPEGRWRIRGTTLAPGQVALAASLPARLRPAQVAAVEVDLRNGGSRALRCAGRDALLLGQRWVSSDGRELAVRELGLNELAGLPQSLGRPVPAGAVATVPVAVYAPPSEGRYRLGILAFQHGRGWLEDERSSVWAEVEVADTGGEGTEPGRST